MAAQDLSTQFDTDWQKAQERYQTGLNSGFSEADAEQLYLAPIRAKWKIIQASPETFQKKGNMAKINSDFEDAGVSAVKNLTRDQPAKPKPGKRPVKGAVPEDSTGKTVSDHFMPLMQKWAMEVTAEKGQSKATAATQKLQVGDLRSQIKRLETKRGTYTYHLNDAKLDPATKTNYTAAVSSIDSQLADLNGQYQTILSGGTLPAAAPAASEVPTPFGQQNTSFQPPAETQPSPAVPSAAGGDSISPDLAASGLRMPAPTPFDEFRQQFSAKLDAELQAQAAPATPASNGKFFISGANGKPDLTNYGGGRTEADAAWAARTAPRISPPADIAPVEPTAATVMADQAKPAVAGNNAPIASQEAYDALASGDQYMDAQGNLRRKK
jgi:hypothetical protein